jgi:hypothetical protein
MNAAFAYLMTTLTVALVISVVSRRGHEIHGRSEVFRYQRGLLVVLKYGTAVPSLITLFIWWVSYSHSDFFELGIYLLFDFVITAFLAYAYFSSRALCVEFNEKGLRIQKLRGDKFYPFEEVRRIVFYQRSEKDACIFLFDKQNRRVTTVPGAIQDIGELASMLEGISPRFGIEFVRDDHFELGRKKWAEKKKGTSEGR